LVAGLLVQRRRVNQGFVCAARRLLLNPLRLIPY